MKCIDKAFSNSFTEVTDSGSLSWCDGMVSGNGEQGVIVACSPYSDTHIYQNIHFIMPSDQPRHIPKEVSEQLHEARQSVINFDDSWDINGRKRTFDYCFHPGHQLRLDTCRKQYSDYMRWIDYRSSEIGLLYTDEDGTWERKTFTSRTDNAVITYIAKSTQNVPVNMTISIDDITTMRGYGRGAETGLDVNVCTANDASYIMQQAVYPVYEESELNGGGYCGLTYIICHGGTKSAESNKITVKDAEYVYLITKCDRTYDLNEDDIHTRLLQDIHRIVEKYTLDGHFIYEDAIKRSRKIQSDMYDRVSFGLEDSKKDNFTCNETLIARQKNQNTLCNELVERVYAQGRYVMICCSGVTMSRLCGMWIGEFNSGWNGIYTMDANVNLQSSSMNTGNLIEFGTGYINFILRQIDDWKENARMVYGMDNAILVPVNFDGNRAMMVEYDWMYPFQYWNAGASWMLQPVYELYQCYGNINIETIYGKKELLNEILVPLLTMQADFWQQLVTPEYYIDADGIIHYECGKKELNEGEKYLIIPSYSPENNAKGRKNRIAANATMDIAAARDGIKMTIKVLEDTKTNCCISKIKELRDLLSKLPDYMYDESGAIKEWSACGFDDNHEHRHISHLYPAWPAFETQENAALTLACNQAIINRNLGNDGHDDFSGHGWLHKALVFTRLKNGKALYEMLYTIFHSDIFYSSLMADHNTTGQFVYCTDTTLGILGIINESLVYSDDKVIELLPALPESWDKGTIRGVRTRCGIVVNTLSWNKKKNTLDVCLSSNYNRSITLKCAGKIISNDYTIKAGESMTTYNIKEVF